MKGKIVIIDPRGWQGAVSGYRPSPNIGIAYLIPMLRKYGHEVLVIDLNNEAMPDAQVLASITEYHPAIVGFSVKTATMNSARILSQLVKKSLPKVPIILGGPHTTLAWQELVKEPCFDIIFVGEGEQVLPVILSRLVAGESIEDFPGVITKRNFKDGFYLNRQLITSTDLNTLPFPEYNDFPQNVRKSICESYPLLTSRGCVYNCTYCSVPEISGKKFRKRSPESVVEELRWAKRKYGITAFEILDDVFNLDMQRCKEICRAIIEANLGISWSCPNGLRADKIDQELADFMFKSGCRSVMVGIESVDSSVLATVKKGETIEDIEKGINIFKKASINVGGFFIIGLPGDSFESQERSVEFVKKMGITAHFNMLVPYPGTELWNWAKANARFLCDIESGLHFTDSPEKMKPVIETDDFPASERRRTYEMVHTRVRRFSMLVPPNLSRWQYYCHIICFLWNYDRWQLLPYMLKKFVNKIWRLFKRGLHLLKDPFFLTGYNMTNEKIRDPIEVFTWVCEHLPLKVKGSLALDIGANVGQYVSSLTSHFDKVLAFEPSIEAFFNLAKKIKDYPNLEIYNVAIYNMSGIIYLYKYEKAGKDFDLTILNEGQSFDCWGSKVERVPVLAIRLDDLHLSSVDFIKLDVEGSELSVIQGSMETLKRCNPTLFIEIHEKSQGEQIIDLLQNMYNFKVLRHPGYAPMTFLWEKHYFLYATPKVKQDSL